MGSGIAANHSHPSDRRESLWDRLGRGWGMGSQLVATGHFLIMQPELA